MIDIHAHILPGIDDGARNLAEAVRMAKNLSEQGVEAVIATSHYINETAYVSPRAENLRLLEQLRYQLGLEEIPIKVFLGNEVYIDPKIWELGQNGKIATLGASRYLLVELPMDGKFPNYEDIFEDLTQRGVQVILAHPERYASIQKKPEIATRLARKGVLLQANLGSFTGKYGRKAMKTVKWLAEKKLIFATGSDIHRPGVEIAKATEKLKEFYDSDEISQILTENPLKVLKNL